VKTLAGMFEALPDKSSGRPVPKASFAPRTPLNVPITGERGFAAVSLPLDTLKQLAAAHEAKLNDIVLALCSGALRRCLALHGGVPRKPLIAAMPISLSAAGSADYTTQATMSLVSLNTHIDDPVQRLRAIRDASGVAKAQARRASGVSAFDFPTIGVPWLLGALASLHERTGIAGKLPPIADLLISNVPGPQQPLYAAGARMSTCWPLNIVEHGLGLNITVMSYAGAMRFGFTAARAAVAEASELSATLLAALDELVACTRGTSARRASARADSKATSASPDAAAA
jgi:diacylglycerol O-acyltransferase / wax synthase